MGDEEGCKPAYAEEIVNAPSGISLFMISVISCTYVSVFSKRVPSGAAMRSCKSFSLDVGKISVPMDKPVIVINTPATKTYTVTTNGVFLWIFPMKCVYLILKRLKPDCFLPAMRRWCGFFFINQLAIIGTKV